MYEVGPWFLHLMNLAIIAIVASIVLIVVIRKRGRYQHEAIRCLQAEIRLPTGWSEYYTIPSDINAKSVTIGSFKYILNPQKRSWGLHPRVPFMGLRTLQVPIRREIWYQDNEKPVEEPGKEQFSLTAAEINAMHREGRALQTVRQQQEIEERQNQLVKVMGSLPSKVVLYGLGGATVVLVLILLVQQFFPAL